MSILLLTAALASGLAAPAPAAWIEVTEDPATPCVTQHLLDEALDLALLPVPLHGRLEVDALPEGITGRLWWAVEGQALPATPVHLAAAAGECAVLRAAVVDLLRAGLDDGRPALGATAPLAPVALLLGGGLAAAPASPRARLDLRAQVGDRWRGQARVGLELGGATPIGLGGRQDRLSTRALVVGLGLALHRRRAGLLADLLAGAALTWLGDTALVVSGPRMALMPWGGVGLERLLGTRWTVGARLELRAPVTLRVEGVHDPVYREPAGQLLLLFGRAFGGESGRAP